MGNPSREAKQLAALARRLKLQGRHLRFIEAMAKDPKKDLVKCYKAAGFRAKSAAVPSRAKHLWNEPRVQTYWKTMMAVIEARAERKATEAVTEALAVAKTEEKAEVEVVRSVESAIASAEEIMEGLTALARGNIMDYVEAEPDGKSFSFSLAKAMADPKGVGYRIDRLAHDKETGAPIVELADRKRAYEILGRFKGLEKAPPGPGVNLPIVNLLVTNFPDAALKDAYFGRPAVDMNRNPNGHNGSNGNGNGASG
jgi:hypothetical protein